MVTAKAAPGLLVGGKYRLVDRIGTGGMGDVFRAENVLAGRLVALKLLRAELSEDEDCIRRFFQEAQTVNRIRHPNIVDVIDAGFAETGPYIAMDLLEGESAAAVLARRRKFPVEAALACGLGVLAALAAAHELGVIHRDLKPQNVFLHRGSRGGPVAVKLLDFGIAKVLAADSGQAPRTHVGLIYGTPDYLSPEQAEGDRDLDGRSDLFSLGVLLFELLSGVRPFAAPTAVATAYRIVHGEVPRLSAVGGPADAALQSVLDRALSKERAARFDDAAAFAAALVAVAPDEQARSRALSSMVANKSMVRSRSRPPASLAARPQPSSWPAASAPSSIAPPVDPTMRSIAPAPSSIPSAPSPAARSSSFPARSPVEPPRVRGAVLRAVDESIVRRFGAPHRERIVERLEREIAGDFRHKTIAPLVLYDLQIFEAYALAANEIVFHDGPPQWREIGRDGVHHELQTLLRPLPRGPADLGSIVRRGIGVWSRLLEFGYWTPSDESPGVVTLHISAITPAPVALRQWLVGVIEQSVRSAGLGRARVEVLLGQVRRAPELKLELAES